MRIALADDSTLFRRGLRRLLEETGLDVADECATGDQLLTLLRTDPSIDAVILDIRMPPTFTDEGITTAAAIRSRHPHIGILVLSTYIDPAAAGRLIASGTSHLGYLLKDRVEDPTAIRDALTRLAHGGSVIDPEIVQLLVARNQQNQALARLTDRERVILAAMAEGRSNNGISHQLYLSPKTIEAHIARIFTKLDMPTEADINRRVRAVLQWLETHNHIHP